MIRLFLFLLGLMLWAGDARADYDAVPAHFMCNQSGTYRDVQQDACQYLSSSYSTPLPYGGGVQASTATGVFPGPYKCTMYFKADKSDANPGTASCTNTWTCPYGGTLNVNVKPTCMGATPPPSCPPDKVGVYNWKITMDANGHVTSGPPLVGSDGQCEIRITGVHYCWQATDGNAYCKYDTVTTGNVRAPSPPTVPATTANPPPDVGSTAGTQQSGPLPGQPGGGCPKGMVNAGIDSGGTTICLGTGYDRPPTTTPTTTTTSAPTTTSNADGSTTTVQNTTSTNADGTKTTVTTTVVTAADGSKTQTQTSSTTARPDGSTGVSSSPSDKNNLCSQNPNLTICQNSTVSGDCTSGFSCTGDAIQCATLRAAAAMQCKQAKDDADFKASYAYSLGSSVLAGSDPAGSTLPSPSKATAVTMPGTLDQTGWLGAGQCFADKVVSVQGRTFVLPYSKACDYLIVLRLGLMVVASLVSFRIVRDAVLT